MLGHDPVVLEAIRNVLGRQSDEDWVPTGSLVDAIYQEIRRLDRVALAQRSVAPPSPVRDRLTTESEVALQSGD